MCSFRRRSGTGQSTVVGALRRVGPGGLSPREGAVRDYQAPMVGPCQGSVRGGHAHPLVLRGIQEGGPDSTGRRVMQPCLRGFLVSPPTEIWRRPSWTTLENGHGSVSVEPVRALGEFPSLPEVLPLFSRSG